MVIRLTAIPSKVAEEHGHRRAIVVGHADRLITGIATLDGNDSVVWGEPLAPRGVFSMIRSASR